jgi:hypothetical protein
MLYSGFLTTEVNEVSTKGRRLLPGAGFIKLANKQNNLA